MAPRSGPRRGGAAAKHWGLKPCTQTRRFQVQGETKQGRGLAALQGRGRGKAGRSGSGRAFVQALCSGPDALGRPDGGLRLGGTLTNYEGRIVHKFSVCCRWIFFYL